MSGFYKNNGNEIQFAPNFVASPFGIIRRENHTEYTYPAIGGWYWFDSEAEAGAFFAEQVTTITRRQCKLWLYSKELLAAVENAVSQMGMEAQIEWNEALTFEITHPLVIQMANMLGIGEAGLVQMFKEASQL